MMVFDEKTNAKYVEVYSHPSVLEYVPAPSAGSHVVSGSSGADLKYGSDKAIIVNKFVGITESLPTVVDKMSVEDLHELKKLLGTIEDMFARIV